MAILHPIAQSVDYIDPTIHGNGGESLIIKKINELDPVKTKNWHFFYSFSFKANGKNRGVRPKDCEIDFLCLLPDIGVFVFEIKGGLISKTTDANMDTGYYSGVNPIKNPYVQARCNFYDLSTNVGSIDLGDSYLTLKDITGDYLVGFPDINRVQFSDPNMTSYNTFCGKDDLYEFFIKAGKQIANTNRRLPSSKDIEKIITALNKKDFTYQYDIKDYIDTVNVRVSMLTEEQYCVLNGLLDNPRCLIYGPAGTGKTVLSSMLLNHFINNKQRVAYFSYNELNAEKVKKDLEYKISDDSYVVSPFLKYAVSQFKTITNQEPPLDENGVINYDYVVEELCNYTNHPLFKKYSAIIIDEAQDIKKGYGDTSEDNLLMLLDGMLVGGLENGSLYVFYDDAQNINFNREPFYKSEEFGPSKYRYAKFRLIKNCRNNENIADKLNEFSSKMPIKELANNAIEYKKCDTPEQMAEHTISIIKDLKSKRVNPQSIVILYTANNKPDSPIHTIIPLLERVVLISNHIHWKTLKNTLPMQQIEGSKD